jgi:hypothetical protein
MGFFDRDVKNSFDRMFDWNDDGKLDSFEQANQFEFEQRMLEEDSVDDDEDDDEDEDDDDDDLDLDLAGLDRFDLEMMDEDERREALEDAGLDPGDYDFD